MKENRLKSIINLLIILLFAFGFTRGIECYRLLCVIAGGAIMGFKDELLEKYIEYKNKKLCDFCGIGDTNNDFGCTNPKCKMHPFR